MKKYNQFMDEIVGNPGGWNPFAKFRKNFKTIERMYPGTHQFLSVANRWIFRADRFQNAELKKLLKRLKRRPDISDMKKADIKKIHNFIEKHNLQDIEKVRDVFSDYSDFTRGNHRSKGVKYDDAYYNDADDGSV
ncbi:MAG: hypothetical protein DRQ78_10060 [Epsilonproteobacteria bacterium]|nr:MAG: hypothetical protein DRQ78_10060 [Campylobacterota bacterium]